MGWLRRSNKDQVPATVHNLLVQSFGQVRRDVQNVYDWLKFLYNQNTFQQRLLEDQRKELSQLKQQVAMMPQNHEEIKALIDQHYNFEPVLEQMNRIDEHVHQISEHQLSQPTVQEIAEQVKSDVQNRINTQIEQFSSQLFDQVAYELDKSKSELREQFSLKFEENKLQQDTSAIDALNQRLAGIQEKLETMQQAAPQIQPVQQIYQPVQPVMHPAQRHSNLKEKLMRSITRNSKEYVKNAILNLIKKYQKITGLQLREILVEEQALVSRSSFYRLLGELEHETSDLSVIQHGKEKIYILQQPVEPAVNTDQNKE